MAGREGRGGEETGGEGSGGVEGILSRSGFLLKRGVTCGRALRPQNTKPKASSGTPVERQWNASGIPVEHKWNTSGTPVEHREHGRRGGAA